MEIAAADKIAGPRAGFLGRPGLVCVPFIIF